MAYLRTAAHPVSAGDEGLSLLQGAEALSEFAGYNGDCGQCALEVLRAIERKVRPQSSMMNFMVRDMHSRNEAEANGVTSLEHLHDMAYRLGIDCALNHDWSGTLNRYALSVPIVLGLGNAGTLPGEHPGLKGHFVTVCGAGPRGYAVADGNTVESRSGTLVYYTHQDLALAQPWGALYPSQGNIAVASHPNFQLVNGVSPGNNGAAAQLADVTGFAGMVNSIDHVEQFSPFTPPASINPVDTLGYAVGWGVQNTGAFAVRSAMVIFGVLLLLGLILAVIRAQVAMAVEEVGPAAMAVGAMV